MNEMQETLQLARHSPWLENKTMDGTTQIIARTIRTKKAIGHRGEINSKSCVTQEMTVLHFPTEAFFFFYKSGDRWGPRLQFIAYGHCTSTYHFWSQQSVNWLSHLSTFFKIAKDLRKWSSGTFEKDISILTFSWDQKNNKCALTRFSLRFFEGIAKVKTLRNVFKWSINGRMNAKNS